MRVCSDHPGLVLFPAAIYEVIGTKQLFSWHLHCFQFKCCSQVCQPRNLLGLQMGPWCIPLLFLKPLQLSFKCVDALYFGLQKERIKQLRKAYGNSLLLAAVLSHNLNFFNMRLILVCGELWWSTQTFLARNKKTAEQNLATAVAFATGAGRNLLRKLWERLVFDAEQLGRLGVQATPDTMVQDFGPEQDAAGLIHPGVNEATSIHRIMDFLGHQMELYYWLFAWKEQGLKIRKFE